MPKNNRENDPVARRQLLAEAIRQEAVSSKEFPPVVKIIARASLLSGQRKTTGWFTSVAGSLGSAKEFSAREAGVISGVIVDGVFLSPFTSAIEIEDYPDMGTGNSEADAQDHGSNVNEVIERISKLPREDILRVMGAAVLQLQAFENEESK